MSTATDEGPDQGKLVEAEDERNWLAPQTSYPGFPVASTGSTDADELLRCILFGRRVAR